MKYSLIIHANGQNSKDYNVYLTDTNDQNWWRLGMLQKIRFAVKADDLIPRLDGGFIGLTIKECDKPNLSEGINVLVSNFALINEDVKIPDIYIRKDDEILGAILEVVFDVDVNGAAKFYISAIDGMVEWANDIPDWVELDLVKFDWQKDANG